MPYQVDSGAVLQITLVQSMFQQTIVNSFHYLLGESGGPVDGIATADAFVDAWENPNGIHPALALCQTQELKYVGILAQWISPIRYAYLFTLPAITQGNHIGAPEPPNVAAAVLCRNELAGDSSKGVKHVAGVPQSANNQGSLTPAYRATLNSFALTLITDFNVNGKTLSPILFRKAGPALGKRIDFADALETLRVIRRRTVGVGI